MSNPPINFAVYAFHPVIKLPAKYEVYDFTVSYDPNRVMQGDFGIGKYNEKRKNMYTSALFVSDQRDVHMGIDIGAPIGTEVHAFFDGEIFLQGYNPAKLDYGHTIITRHTFDGVELFALHGHLSKRSIELRDNGQPIRAGEVIAYLGDKPDNGGWNPHLHFQLSYEKPATFDMPGVVNEKDREAALKRFPDPRLVLGMLYEG